MHCLYHQGQCEVVGGLYSALVHVWKLRVLHCLNVLTEYYDAICCGMYLQIMDVVNCL